MSTRPPERDEQRQKMSVEEFDRRVEAEMHRQWVIFHRALLAAAIAVIVFALVTAR